MAGAILADVKYGGRKIWLRAIFYKLFLHHIKF